MSYQDKDWQEALRRIEEARLNGGIEVDLSDLKIYSIPDELLTLADTLEVLDLSYTNITDITPLVGLTRLKVLQLYIISQ